MTRDALEASIVKGLPLLLALMVGSATGCSSADGPSEPGDLTTDQLAQGWHVPKVCAGLAGSECRGGEVCLPFLSRGCPGPHRVGYCIPRPRECPPISDPVCGCDGETYSNLCEAAHAGVVAEHAGACEPPPPPPAEDCSSGLACAGAGSCVDDPSDTCDPAAASSDADPPGEGDYVLHSRGGHHDDEDDGASAPAPTQCPSVCACTVTEQCARGLRWNADPAVCACVPEETDPCARVECPTGTRCIAQPDGTATCDPL